MSPKAVYMKVFNKKKLQDLIEESGKTIAQIAAEIGFSPKQIIAWKEGDAEPRAETLTIIARHFHVSIDWLLDVYPERTGHLGSGEKSLSADELEFVDAFRSGDLPRAMTIFMAKLNKQIKKRKGE